MSVAKSTTVATAAHGKKRPATATDESGTKGTGGNRPSMRRKGPTIGDDDDDDDNADVDGMTGTTPTVAKKSVIVGGADSTDDTHASMVAADGASIDPVAEYGISMAEYQAFLKWSTLKATDNLPRPNAHPATDDYYGIMAAATVIPDKSDDKKLKVVVMNAKGADAWCSIKTPIMCAAYRLANLTGGGTWTDKPKTNAPDSLANAKVKLCLGLNSENADLGGTPAQNKFSRVMQLAFCHWSHQLSLKLLTQAWPLKHFALKIPTEKAFDEARQGAWDAAKRSVKDKTASAYDKRMAAVALRTSVSAMAKVEEDFPERAAEIAETAWDIFIGKARMIFNPAQLAAMNEERAAASLSTIDPSIWLDRKVCPTDNFAKWKALGEDAQLTTLKALDMMPFTPDSMPEIHKAAAVAQRKFFAMKYMRQTQDPHTGEYKLVELERPKVEHNGMLYPQLFFTGLVPRHDNYVTTMMMPEVYGSDKGHGARGKLGDSIAIYAYTPSRGGGEKDNDRQAAGASAYAGTGGGGASMLDNAAFTAMLNKAVADDALLREEAKAKAQQAGGTASMTSPPPGRRQPDTMVAASAFGGDGGAAAASTLAAGLAEDAAEEQNGMSE